MPAIIPDAARTLKSAGAPLEAQASFAADLMALRAASAGFSEVMVQKAQERGMEQVRRGAMLCDSPIEKRVLPWLVFEDYGPQFMTIPALVHDPKAFGDLPSGDLLVIPQFAFARYRLDFAIVGRLKGQTKIVCVECDGINQHKGDHDMLRDRYLADWGIPTVRISGPETAQFPRKASQQASDLMRAWAEGL